MYAGNRTDTVCGIYTRKCVNFTRSFQQEKGVQEAVVTLCYVHSYHQWDPDSFCKDIIGTAGSSVQETGGRGTFLWNEWFPWGAQLFSFVEATLLWYGSCISRWYNGQLHTLRTKPLSQHSESTKHNTKNGHRYSYSHERVDFKSHLCPQEGSHHRPQR